MIDQDSLREMTESYLKSLIAEASGSVSGDFDQRAPFGELGINSFHVLKIIKALEGDFGVLPKSLLFEHFNVADLAGYFIGKHESVLQTKFDDQLSGNGSRAAGVGRASSPSAATAATRPAVATRSNGSGAKAEPIRMLERDALLHPWLGGVVRALFAEYKSEGCVSRGTRRIAPNVFIGSERRGYFNYGRNKGILLVYGYTGPRDYLQALVVEVVEFCERRKLALNILADEQVPDVAFSATPFGAMQRIVKLREFSLEGGAMRRLRYQVSHFEKAGVCGTAEYRCGSNATVDRRIVEILDRWCESRTAVNPLVHDVRGEILAGALAPEHRLFVTSLNDVIQNVILITEMAAREKGYLMDLEFYLPEMPLGGLEFAIVQIIRTLASEGCDVLSLGGTYGCKLAPSPSADPDVDRVLHELRDQGIFNDAGNLQFKNKFRPETKPIYLCRPRNYAGADDVIDVIMMIADPVRMQTPDDENHNPPRAETARPDAPEAIATPQERVAEARLETRERPQDDGRTRALAEAGFNPMNVADEAIDFDLKTDSWAQLSLPAIDAQSARLRGRVHRQVDVERVLRTVFPFSHVLLTDSGQGSEARFFRAWPTKGVVLQNLLFPSTIAHEIDNGFTGYELPTTAAFDVASMERWKGGLDWSRLERELDTRRASVAFVCVELGNNAAGGAPLALRELEALRALSRQHGLALVVDCTRVVENARFVIEEEAGQAGRDTWAVVRELLSCADVAIGSLTKDFCVPKGGVIATSDGALMDAIRHGANLEGGSLDLIDRRIVAASLEERQKIEVAVRRRMEAVRRLWHALRAEGMPVVNPAGGHCVLIDAKRAPEFHVPAGPAAAFVAWLYAGTGIRASVHSVGMQRDTPLNDLVRLAVPIGLRDGDLDEIVARMARAWARRANIPTLTKEAGLSAPGRASYRLVPRAGAEAPLERREPERAAHAALRTTETQQGDATTAADAGRAPAAIVEQVAKPADRGVDAQSPGAGPTDDATRRAPSRPRGGDVAVVGMAGRYPQARSIDELWQNLRQGRDCIEELPAERYVARLRHERPAKYRGGFIDGIDRFDSLFFNISPREAELIDPQERLFLEVAWEAIEDAGYYPETAASGDEGRKVGVFVGAVWALYQMLGIEERHLGGKVSPSSFLWSIANRVSYWMNFSGPSLTVDTACSSSLTALYLACEAIRAGDCRAAIVGGVNLDLHQAKLDINLNGGALSSDGVCRSFGKGANGYVAGEGVGALFLKPLEDALRDRDYVYGIIRSTAVNHGGRTSGYIVPNPKAQATVIAAALERAGVDARSIGYIEAHGTGTELGDPLEIAGLTSAFSEGQVAAQTCGVGSIKSNIGHLEAAAGVASVTKVLLQMKHRQLAPSLHADELNPFIEFDKTPFYVVRTLEDWRPRSAEGKVLPLRAGVSSFGAGGANAHVVLEAWETPAHEVPVPEADIERSFPLSARTEEQLRAMAARLAVFLEREPGVGLRDVAFTLQFGRKSFEHRLAVVARTQAELVSRLGEVAQGKTGPHVLCGRGSGADSWGRLLNRREKEEFVRLLLQRHDPHKVAELWTEGVFADWSGLEPEKGARRVPLPTYPFAGKRHWIVGAAQALTARAPGMHPMLDSNESTFERQVFKKVFHDQDFFIYDHHVADIPTLPGVAYLELARKAGEVAAGKPVRSIRNIIWVSPISVEDGTPKEVFVELKPSGETVQFEVFSAAPTGAKVLHSQGKLTYAPSTAQPPLPDRVDIESIRARCVKAIEGQQAYPLFKSFGLNLGPSFQVLREVYKGEGEVLGALELPECRHDDLESMVLLPSLVDGSLQAGVAAHLAGTAGEMLVPFSIGEVEILHPLQGRCFSYTTEAKEGAKAGPEGSGRVVKSNVLIVDEHGTVLVKLRDCTGVPLRDVHKKEDDAPGADGFATVFYAYDWEPAPLEAGHEQGLRKHAALVLFDSGEELSGACRERLRQQGEAPDIVIVRAGEAFEPLPDGSYRIDPTSKADMHRLVEGLAQRGVGDVFYAWPLGLRGSGDVQRVEAVVDACVLPFLFLCQALVQHKLESQVQLLYAYAGSDTPAEVAHEAMTGFVNTLRVEHPRLLCKVVEVRAEGEGVAAVALALLAERAARTQDGVGVRHLNGARWVRRLKPAKLDEPVGAAAPGVAPKASGVYLITGGAGGLGLIFADYLAREFQARLLLSGRSAPSEALEARLDELRQAGAEVVYVAADVSTASGAQLVVEAARTRFGRLDGVVHAAGLLRDSYVRNKTVDEFRAVLAPKVQGTLHLDEATRTDDLDFFVTFSSLASVAGNAGQSDYGFANHFMDSFAAERERLRAQGTRPGKALSINWSLWADGGMRPDEQTEIYLKKTLGMRPLRRATGVAAFTRGLASGLSQFAVLEGIPEKLDAAWGGKKRTAEPAAAPSAPARRPWLQRRAAKTCGCGCRTSSRASSSSS